MTLRPLPRSRLDGLIPPLVTGQHFIALVPITGDARWAAGAAWSVARSVAASGRRVALVDLCIDQPQLHLAVGLPMGRGIVDAFQQGDELTNVAHEIDGVFFIPTGTATQAPEFVLAHPRLKKLHAGFRAEDAVLFVFIAGGAVARLGEVPDSVIALAPEGVNLDSPAAAGLVTAQSQGAALLGVVRERWTPIGTPAPPPSSIMFPRPAPRRSRRGLVAAGVVAMALLGAAAWVVFAGGLPRPEPVPRPMAERAASLPGAAAPGTAAPRTAAPAATRAPDTLAWTVQLAAYGTLDNALAHVDKLKREKIHAFVTPVEATRAVWYRVLVGVYATRDSAAAARERLWDANLARRGNGELLRAPYSLALPSTANPDSLRAQGLPAFRLQPHSRLLLGAFETPEQAVLAQTQLERAGIAATLIARLEVTP